MTLLEIIFMLLFTFAAAIAVHYTFLSFYILEHARQDDAITKVLVHAENLYGKGGSHNEGFRPTGMTGGEVVAPLTFGGNAKIKHMHAPIWGTTASDASLLLHHMSPYRLLLQFNPK